MPSQTILKLDPQSHIVIRDNTFWRYNGQTGQDWVAIKNLFAGEEADDLRLIKAIENCFKVKVLGQEKQHDGYKSDYTIITHQGNGNGTNHVHAGPRHGGRSVRSARRDEAEDKNPTNPRQSR